MRYGPQALAGFTDPTILDELREGVEGWIINYTLGGWLGQSPTGYIAKFSEPNDTDLFDAIPHTFSVESLTPSKESHNLSLAPSIAE